MKNLFICTILFVLLTICACQPSTKNVAAKTEIPTQISTQTPLPEVEDELENEPVITDKSGDIQMVFMGYLEFKDGKLVSDNDWAVGEGDLKIEKGITLDVMTCAGFVTQAKLKQWHGEGQDTDEGYQWELEFITPNLNIAALENKLKKCHTDDYRWTGAFAIYPSKPERAKIEMTKTPDLKKVFDSLSTEDKKWVATDDQPKDKNSTQKDSVDIDEWTDSDGDGKIDLIQLSGTCNGLPSGDLTCLKVLHLSGKTWKIVGELATD